jgi:hypothetical protein
MPSEPYPPLDPAPKDFTLSKALQATQTPDGKYHCGKLDFDDVKQYQNFRAAQLAMGGTKTQLAVLHAIETTGQIPQQGPMNPAPAGTKVEDLLDLRGQQPDKNGFYHLGSLQIQKGEYDKFVELQKDLCGKNPEALNALYHMENAKTPPALTYAITKNDDRNDRYDPNTNTIYFNPNTAVRDAFNGARVPPATAALHEQTHWAGRKIGDVLQGIPYGNLDNAEEARVIEGSEARDMKIRDLPARHSHFGDAINVRGLDSITPSMEIQQNGVSRHVSAPFSQSGKIIESRAEWTTIAIRGDGKSPDQQMKFKTEELQLAMGGGGSSVALLDGAQKHGDTVTFKLGNDGQMIYQNPAQQHRLEAHPLPNVTFPQNGVIHDAPASKDHSTVVVGGR